MMFRLPAAFRPLAFRFLGLPVPAEELKRSSRFAYRTPTTGVRTSTGIPRSTHTRSDWGGRPLYPEDSGVLRLLVSPTATARRLSTAGPFTPELTPICRG